jgi:hypothetical protein
MVATTAGVVPAGFRHGHVPALAADRAGATRRGADGARPRAVHAADGVRAGVVGVAARPAGGNAAAGPAAAGALADGGQRDRGGRPREWVDGLDRTGRPCLRLHLLPETDYLGWDRLLAGGKPAPAMPDTPHLWAVDAYPLRFHRRRLAGLAVLRGEVAAELSPLGRQLAGRIVHAHTGQRDRQFR